ncbi:hypothetical protein PGT21_004213 [Puccinia graminis f. sp. tritici]|uniref:Uncharacterized protein n=1 Tax=Puccinia graminis f. sp. tritici TaxID=56615 RepID=A0A5B0SKB8_PUCGR|nr:hypothetical protein PGT21_004213 [Puccinia graminis f. sp. tritici]KAA1137809.1 hypothetical protein PGTUg99_021720 [Puccinia graminis f. sp. tritici]
MHRPLFLIFSWCCALAWAADPDPLRSHPLSSSWWDHEYDCDSEAAWIPAHQLLASFSTSHLQLSLPPAQLSQSTALSLRRAKAKLPPAPSFVPSSTTTTTTSSFFQHGSPSHPRWKLSTSVSNPTPSPSSPSSATPALATRTFHTLEAISSHLLAPNEVHDQDHPDSQTPIAIENLMNEMRQIITNSGSEHGQAGSSQASKGTPVRQPSDRISSDSAQREAQEKAATIQQLLSSPNHLSLFTENGNIWTLLLKRYHRKFVHEVLSIEFDDQPVSPQIETQRDLCFVMVSRSKSGGPTGFTYRILCHGGRVMQGSNSLIKLAKALLKTIHKLHEIILNKPGHISSFVHYSRQEKLLEWLHALIFSDHHGAPLIGIRKNIDPTWRKGDELGQAKLLLIHYFGQVLIEPQLLISTAYDLIKLFMAEDGFNYLPPTRPFGHSTDLPSDPYFEARERVLFAMTEKSSKKYSMLFRSRNNFTGDDGSLRASIGEFEKACPREEMTNLYQSNHPRLSVIMYFLDKSPGMGHIRVAVDQKNVPVPSRQIRNSFKRLLRATNYLHQEVYNRLDIRTQAWNTRRKAFYNWLIALLLLHNNNHHPYSLPLFGSIRLAHPHRAPWEERAADSVPLFSPAQLRLVDFLSRKHTVRSLKTFAARFVTTWYHDHLPHEYEKLQFID